MLIRGALGFFLAALVAGGVSFIASRMIEIDSVSTSVMQRIETSIATRAQGKNKCFHFREYGPRNGTVARANPDTLVTSLSYDLREGPIELSGPVWDDYWSLSVYQHNTDNIFVVNDRELPNGEFRVIIHHDVRDLPIEGFSHIVKSPTSTGVVLIRRFISGEDKLPAAHSNQDEMYCGPTGLTE